MSHRLSCLMALLVSGYASFGQVRTPPIDLRKFGFPPLTREWIRDCLVPYRGYHWVEWLDDHRIVVAFNTSQVCPQGAKDAAIPGNVRILVLSDTGELQHSED